jgi:hypothetical protein
MELLVEEGASNEEAAEAAVEKPLSCKTGVKIGLTL